MKGVLFTFMIVLIALTLVSLIGIQKTLTSYYREKMIIGTRVKSMNNFYDDIIIDSSKALDIITKESVVIAISRIVTSGEPLEDAVSVLEELILDGTFNGTSEVLMENSTFQSWIERMEGLGILKGFNTNIEFQNLEIQQYDSWNLLASIDIHINISDKQTSASLKRNISLNQLVSVEGFEDPIFPLNTFGRATSIIKKSPYWGNFTQKLITSSGSLGWFAGISVVFPSSEQGSIQNVPDKDTKVLVIDDTTGIEALANSFGGLVTESNATGILVPFVHNAANAMSLLPNNTYILVDGNNGNVWNIENLNYSVENSYYYPSKKGATFLERLEGNLESVYQTGIGLETFVDKSYLINLEVPVSTGKTNVDHLFFSPGLHSGNAVKGLANNFRIDDELCTGDLPHSEIYNVSEILI